MKTQRRIQCHTHGCSNYLKVWTVHSELYMVPVDGYSHNGPFTYSIVERDGGFVAEQSAQTMIYTGLHTWPVLFCDGCGGMPVEIYEKTINRLPK